MNRRASCSARSASKPVACATHCSKRLKSYRSLSPSSGVELTFEDGTTATCDLLIGAAFADRGADTSGAAYVVFGKGTPFGASINLSSLDGNTGFKLTGTGAHDATGHP